MTRPPDMIRFGPLPKPFPRTTTFGWAGPWPPPERLTIAVGVQSGMVSVVGENIDAATLAEAKSHPTIRMLPCRRVSASQLPSDFGSNRVARGAQYEPEP